MESTLTINRASFAELITILDQHPELKALTLVEVLELQDLACLELVPQLVRLTLRGMRKLTSLAGVAHVPALTELVIDELNCELQLPTLPALTQLRVSMVLPSVDLQAVLNQTPSLVKLELCAVNLIDSGRLEPCCPRLTDLRLTQYSINRNHHQGIVLPCFPLLKRLSSDKAVLSNNTLLHVESNQPLAYRKAWSLPTKMVRITV